MTLQQVGTPAELGRIVGLREAGWMYRWIAAHVGHNISVVCRCFQQWSVERFHIHSSGQPHSTDAHQDRCIFWAMVAARTASREEIRTHVAPAVSPRIIGNSLLAAGLRSCVPLPRLSLTPQHNQAQLLWCRERSTGEWNGSRFCLYVNDECTCVQHKSGEHHLLECIRPWHIGLTTGFMVWGAINYNFRSHLVFLKGKVNSVCHIAQIVNPVLQPFIQQEGDVLFQQNNVMSTHARRSDGSMSASGSAGPGFDPRRGSKFSFQNF